MPTETMSFVSIDWSLIMQLGNLFILLALLKHFLFKPVQAILDKRQAQVSEIYQKAESAQQSAEEMKAEYTEKLAAAHSEATNILKNANQKAQQREEEILQDAQKKAAVMLQKADEDIAQEKKKAVNEIKNDLSGIAVDIASKVLEREISAEDHEALMEEFIKNVGDAS
jgi:F-type H+-transporting ATPase subunit b